MIIVVIVKHSCSDLCSATTLRGDLVPSAVQSRYPGVPRMYRVYYTSSVRRDSLVELCSCLRGTPEHLN